MPCWRWPATPAPLIYIANPDNPMGSHHPAATIRAMIDACPPGALIVLDEAYIDLAPPGTAPDLNADDPRVIRMRTFSKGYGLAGLRVGYAIGAAGLISAFNKVRNHFGMGRVAQAGALAALQDQAWLAHVQASVQAARVRAAQIAADNGLMMLPSATNFATIDCGRDGDFARAVLRACVERGLFIRMPFVAPMDRCIRVSLGPPPMMDVLAEVLPRRWQRRAARRSFRREFGSRGAKRRRRPRRDHGRSQRRLAAFARRRAKCRFHLDFHRGGAGICGQRAAEDQHVLECGRLAGKADTFLDRQRIGADVIPPLCAHAVHHLRQGQGKTVTGGLCTLHLFGPSGGRNDLVFKTLHRCLPPHRGPVYKDSSRNAKI
jgi:hypothetical protein